MAKKYKIEIGVDASQAVAKFKDLRKVLGDVDKSAAGLVADFQRARDAAKTSAEHAKASMIGYFDLVVKGIKFQDKLRQDSLRQQIAWEKKHVISVGQLHESALKAKSDLIKRELQEEAQKFVALGQLEASALRAKSTAIEQQMAWERKHVVEIKDLQLSAMRVRSETIGKQLKEEAKRFVSVNQLEQSAAKAKSDLISRQLQEETRRFVSVDQLQASALKAKSDAINQELKEEGRRFVSVNQLVESAAKVKSDAINRDLHEERRRFVAVEQLERSAVAVKSKYIDQQLRQEMDFSSQFTKALTNREIAQVVTNEKMSRANQERVDAARRAAGLEEEANGGMIRSMGMMIARFGVYHLAIGKGTQLWNDYAGAVQGARQAQEQMLTKFTDEQASVRRLAVSLGRRPDTQFMRELHEGASRSGMEYREFANFAETSSNTSAQFVVQPNEPLAQQDAVGRKLTGEQNRLATEWAARFTAAHGLEAQHSASLLGAAMGQEDVRGMGTQAGAERILRRFALPSLVLEHGRGYTPQLQEQAAQFTSNFGQEFGNDPIAISTFLSTVAQGGKSAGADTFTQSRQFISELNSPSNAKLRKLYGGIRLANGQTMMRGGEMTEATAPERIAAIRAHLDRLNLHGLARNQWIRSNFSAKTGMSAATQVFGDNAEQVEAERLNFVQRQTLPGVIQSDIVKEEQAPDLQLRRAEAKAAKAEFERVAPDADIKRLQAEGRAYRFTHGVWGGAPGSTRSGLVKMGYRAMSLGQADVSEEMFDQLAAQAKLQDQLFGLDKEAFHQYIDKEAFTPLSTPEYSKSTLLKLNERVQKARAARAGMGNVAPAGGPRASRVEGGPMSTGNQDVVALLERATKALEDINRRGERVSSSGQTAAHFPSTHDPLPNAFLSGTLLS